MFASAVERQIRWDHCNVYLVVPAGGRGAGGNVLGGHCPGVDCSGRGGDNLRFHWVNQNSSGIILI